LPENLFNLIISPTDNSEHNDKRFDSSIVWEGIPDGERDDQLFRYGCQLRSLNAPHDVAEKLILEAASRCKPPFPEQEALQKLEQAWKYDAGHSNDKKGATRKPILDTVSEIEREEVSWLGHHRIPRGKITIIEGDPGQGKSFLTQALAAAVSLGFCFPDDERKEPENVIIMSAEDGAGDTIRPRLEDMQGNLEKIVLLRGMTDEKGNEAFLTLADLDVIEKAIVQVSPALVIIDPIIAYVAGKDTYKASEVRSLLAPLASLAEKYNVAIVCVRHLNKGNMKSNYRGQGSIDFLAACRSAFLCGTDPEDPKLKVLCQIKSNCGPITPSLNYSIENGQFVWGDEVQTTPEQILADSDGKEKSRLEEAMDFLKEELADGAVIVSQLQKDARQLGISWGTVKRARYRLGIKVQKRFGDLKSPWEWKLKP
jgi:AAA domain